MSNGTEDESCVIYWKPTTPATSNLSGNYTGFSGTTCQPITGDWSKYQSSKLHRPRFDFIKLNGRLITPNETTISRNGITIITAKTLVDACNTAYDTSIDFIAFTEEFDSPYNECCVILNGKNKNWDLDLTIKNPYGIRAIPKSITNNTGEFSLVIPPKFFSDMKNNPEKMNTEFSIEWNAKLRVSGECLANKIIESYASSFYPYGNPNNVYYRSNLGIVFNNAEGFTNGNVSNALTSLNEMQALIRKLFINDYNCYAREISTTQYYGDIIKATGRLYDEHGSECWFILKQVLRPTIAPTNVFKEEQLKGFNLPTTTITPIVETNSILPQQESSHTLNLSNLFKKSTKICPTLPKPLKYK
jgi:hypothetical protein